MNAASGRFDLAGKTALITGAAGGIGAALACGLATRGAHLILTDRDMDGLERLRDRLAGGQGKGKVEIRRLSVEDTGQIAELAQSPAQGPDLLINNAGVALGGAFDDLDMADFDWLMRVNFFGPIHLTKALLPLMSARPDAMIVNISSIFGLVAPPGQTAYAASKFALRGFSAALSHELSGGPVSVCCVHPGGVRTNIARAARTAKGIGAAERDDGIAAMERSFRLSAEQAATVILDGIERRRARILVGRDVRLVSVLERLMPVGYWKILRRGMKMPRALTNRGRA